MSNVVVSPESGTTGCPGLTQAVGSDRYAWFVNSISSDGKTVVIERPSVRGVGEWPCNSHEFSRRENPQTKTLVFRYGSWFIKADEKEKARLIAAKEFGYRGSVEYAGKMKNISFGGMFEYRDPHF